MDFLVNLVGKYLFHGILVLSIVVFVHELGHYLVGKWAGVRVVTFSIGFGPEIFGWNDRSGTRWKVCWLPLGGFVRFFGDADASSRADNEALAAMSEAERRVSFPHQKLGWRMAIVAAGPFANFLFAVIVLAGLYMTVGQSHTPPVVGGVEQGSAAEVAGLQPGDRVVAVGGSGVERFEDLQGIIRLNQGTPVDIRVVRGESEITLRATPSVTEETDRFGNSHKLGRLGIRGGKPEFVVRDPAGAVYFASREVVSIVDMTLTSIGQMIMGSRSAEDLGGPIRMTEMAGQMAEIGLPTLIWYAAVISVSLGLMNLFPVPMLDGGHLLFYAFEALRGKPLGEKVQEYGFRFGLAVVLTLMIFTTWNDVSRHFDFLRRVADLLS